MKVILNSDIKSLGKKGELVTVSDGYARNYLFPRNLAVEANNTTLNELKNRENSKEFHTAQEKRAAEASKQKIDGKEIVIHAKSGANGKLFGAVTAKEVSTELNKVFGINVDKKKISMNDIKSYGSFTAEVKFYTGISAKITVSVAE